MAWVAVNRYGDEYIFEALPERLYCVCAPTFCEYELGELTNFEETEDEE